MNPVVALERLGGVARLRHLRESQVDPRALAAAVRAGAVERPHRGCYALPNAHVDAIRCRVMSAQLTCESAAMWWGLPLLTAPRQLHLAITKHRGFADDDPRDDAGVRWHRIASGTAAQLCVAPAVALDHFGACAGAREQLIALDAALNRRWIDLSELPQFTATSPRRRAWLAMHADGRSESPGETLARVELVRAGLTVEPQRRLRGVGRVDLWVEDMLAVEIDGRSYHSDPKAFSEDRRRDRACTRAEVPFLRFPAALALSRPRLVAEQVMAVLEARRRRAA